MTSDSELPLVNFWKGDSSPYSTPTGITVNMSYGTIDNRVDNRVGHFIPFSFFILRVTNLFFFILKVLNTHYTYVHIFYFFLDFLMILFT